MKTYTRPYRKTNNVLVDALMNAAHLWGCFDQVLSGGGNGGGGNMTIQVLNVYANDVDSLFDQLEGVRAQRSN